MRKISGHKLCQFIIKKYIKQNINWPREIKLAQKLIKIHKDYIFWDSLKELRLPSLAWFLTEEGKSFITIESIKNKIKLFQPKKYILDNEKKGDDKKIHSKPKNVLDFIKKYNI